MNLFENKILEDFQTISQILTLRLGVPRKHSCPENFAPGVPDFYHGLSSILPKILDLHHG